MVAGRNARRVRRVRGPGSARALRRPLCRHLCRGRGRKQPSPRDEPCLQRVRVRLVAGRAVDSLRQGKPRGRLRDRRRRTEQPQTDAPLAHSLRASASAWAPNGRSIAYETDRTGSGDIYLIGADGHNQVQLAAHLRRTAFPPGNLASGGFAAATRGYLAGRRLRRPLGATCFLSLLARHRPCGFGGHRCRMQRWDG